MQDPLSFGCLQDSLTLGRLGLRAAPPGVYSRRKVREGRAVISGEREMGSISLGRGPTRLQDEGFRIADCLSP
jgi:hypothetical protein